MGFLKYCCAVVAVVYVAVYWSLSHSVLHKVCQWAMCGTVGGGEKEVIAGNELVLHCIHE